MKEKIRIEELRKSFGPKTVLDGLSFSVYEGEILCILERAAPGSR